MFREWSIADGPADLTDQDVNIERTFVLNTGEPLPVLITGVGKMHGGEVHSFAGRTKTEPPCEVIGTYNTRTHSGHCHTLPPAA